MLEWITNTMNSLGYTGIALLMLLENLFPPIPSELIMPLAGFTAAQGKLLLVPVILAGVIGTVLGALFWYYVGRLVDKKRLSIWSDRYGKWLGVSSQDIVTATQWFDRRGNQAVFFGRIVPGVRTLISIPAGISRMPMVPFLLYSTLGSILWVGLLTSAGYLLGNNYHLVEQYTGSLSKIVLLTLVAAFVIWLVVKRQRV